MEWDENDIEYVIRHLDVPESLMDEEFIEWLGVKEHQELFDLLLNQREAFLRFEDRGNIDVEAEYRRFLPKLKVRKRILYWGWRVAAVLVLATAAWLLVPKADIAPEAMLSATYEGKKTAELILADGKSVRLENNNVEFQDQNGVWVVNDSTRQLEYRHDTLKEGSGKKNLTYNTLRIPAGADYVVRLSDGTRVHLNCESEFRFPVVFAENERKVYLEGEAFFEVEKSSKWPFIVVTDKMKVQVTGTRFNVKSYKQENVVATTLVSGSVEVESEGFVKAPVRLTAAQQFRLDKSTGHSEVKEVDVRLYTAWTEGMFVFKNQRLEDVMEMLARWYSVEVFYVNPSVKDLRLSANLGRYEHIDSLLQIIQEVNKIKMERRGSVITLDWK